MFAIWELPKEIAAIPLKDSTFFNIENAASEVMCSNWEKYRSKTIVHQLCYGMTCFLQLGRYVKWLAKQNLNLRNWTENL